MASQAFSDWFTFLCFFFRELTELCISMSFKQQDPIGKFQGLLRLWKESASLGM